MLHLRSRSPSGADALFGCREDWAVPQSPCLQAAALESAVAGIKWNGICETAFKQKNTSSLILYIKNLSQDRYRRDISRLYTKLLP